MRIHRFMRIVMLIWVGTLWPDGMPRAWAEMSKTETAEVPPAPVQALKPSPPPEAYSLVTATIAEGANVWLPSTLIVESGATVTLTLRNASQVEHGFAIDVLGVKEVLPPGGTKEVVIKPGGSGPLRYYCPIHKGHIGGQLFVHRLLP